MKNEKNTNSDIKSQLHPRNRHRKRYDIEALVATHPPLEAFVELNPYGDKTVNFFNPAAVKSLNAALLMHHYGLDFWDVPKEYLTPPIPGRADYVHYVADILAEKNGGKIPTGSDVLCADIGTGSSLIFPILGAQEYDWSFNASEIDLVSIESAGQILEKNPFLKEKIAIKTQTNPDDLLFGVIHREEKVDAVFCNPPFHSSLEEAQKGTLRKLRNLRGGKINKAVKNFGGVSNELWCKGGEVRFVKDYIRESKKFSSNVFWFTCLISKESTLRKVYQALKAAEPTEVKTIEMRQGQKKSRFVAWTFLTDEQQKTWYGGEAPSLPKIIFNKV